MSNLPSVHVASAWPVSPQCCFVNITSSASPRCRHNVCDAGARCCCTRYRDLAVGNQPSGLTDAYQHSCRAEPLYHRFERRLSLPGGPNCCLEAPVQLLLSCLSHSSTAPASSESSAAVTPSTLIQCAAGVLNISFLICSSTLRGSTHLA